jgi:hypothetical protein
MYVATSSFILPYGGLDMIWVRKSGVAQLSGAPDESGSYSKDLNEGLVETLNLYVDLSMAQCCEICVPGRKLGIW